MMITTWSDAENMQDNMGIDGSVMPLAAAASSFASHVPLAPRQTPCNRAGDRALASLWIQRLKPLDETEGFNAEKFSSIERKHTDAFEKEQSMCEQGGGRIVSSYILPDSGGFEQIKGVTSNRPAVSATNSWYRSEGLQTSSRAVEGRISVLHGAQADGSTFVVGKPPLPRMHGKCGFPPRHPGYKFQGFSSSSALRISSSATDGGILAIGPRITSSASKETVLAVNTPNGSPLKEGHHAKNAFDHGIIVTKEEELTINGKIGITQCMSTSILNPPKQSGSQDPNVMAITLLETPRLKNLNGLEAANAGGIKVQSAQTGGERVGSFLTERSASKPAIHCHGRSPKLDKTLEAASNASSTATFPWEMFAEVSGPSGIAREEFVEVYNRARNELKNQKASSLVTKAPGNDVESYSGFASRGAPYVQSSSIAVHDRQNSESGSQLKMLEKLEHVSQPEVFEKRQQCARFLEGGVTKKNSQVYESVHVASGKDSSSMLHGELGGPFHSYAEPLSVAPREYRMTLKESSELRPGFANSRASEQCNQTFFTHKKLSQPKTVDETDVKMMDIKAPMLLSKRPAVYFDGSPAGVVSKEFGKQRENSNSRSEIWLQRWYPSHRSSHEHKPLKLDTREPDLAGCFNMDTEAIERDNRAAYRGERDFKKRLIEKGNSLQRFVAEAAEPEHLRSCSGRMLPSAAAMGVVGTTARQFCTMQPQLKKDSFAFWSGFGTPALMASFIQRGHRRHSSELEPQWKS